MVAYIRITRRERFLIWSWYYQHHLNLRQIAIKLGRPPKTIYAEVKNNRPRPDVALDKIPYDPEYADMIAYRRRVARKQGKIQTDKATLTRIRKAIEDKKWSIPMIAHGVKHAPTAPTLYRYLKRGVSALNAYIPHKYHKPAPSMAQIMRSNKESELITKRSIDQRPLKINNRQNVGHWEMDCIDSPKGVSTSLLVFVERKSRYVQIYKVRHKRYDQIGIALKDFLHRQRDNVKSITTDRGHEFANSNVLSLLTKANVEVYFTHAYSPGEKGTIERINRDIRKFFPKGQSLAPILPAEIKRVENIINHYPREVLSWQTPRKVFSDLMRRKRAVEKHRQMARIRRVLA
ncbi:IS30 family transposase [Weissella confusa]|uniref:IS30 family transposase n=1 Tax=Weissella fermenti TaxID=2987699 RepID=A0ABT6D4X9_9LACO|nr:MULTISPECIES: IS30 family transposase [Weissella]MBJ7688586.1 IS30 family transposase [Weissella confusa]MCW0927985.1 IS30 family transposase [Weissella sp. LMG 11983]MDF9300576.1 IS30 family transposase [Weissella sp. BK2]